MAAENVQVFAHRGGRMWAPENTMAAFRRAVELGVDGIELDVQRCASGELIVIHDEDLERTTNGVGLVADISYDEISRLSAGLWFDQEFRDEKVPLLADVLDLVAGSLTVNVEIKNSPVAYPGIEEELLELLSSYGHSDKIIVSSFDHFVLERLKNLDSSLNLALLVDAVLLDMPQYAQRLGARFFHPCFSSCRQEVVEEAHAAGFKVNAWTLNKRREWSMALKMGIDGFVTDDPEGLMVYLRRAELVPVAESDSSARA